MMRMNKVMLIGNLTRDPVLRKTSKGLAVADLGLAVSDGYGGKNGGSEESTCFVDVVAWDKQAIVCGEHLHKGSAVMIEGRLRYEEWKDKENQRRHRLSVNADRVQFMPKAMNGSAKSASSSRSRSETRED